MRAGGAVIMIAAVGVEALLWGLVSAASLPLGALLFVLTIELFAHVPHYVEDHGLSAFAASLGGACLGGLLFDGLNQYLNNRGAFLRRLSNARTHVAQIRIRRSKELIKELGQVKILNHLQPDQMAQIIRQLQEARFKKGEVIFRQGDVGREMYFTVSGQVEIVLHDEREGQENVALQDPHELFGELGILFDAPHSADAIAVTDVRVYKLLKDDLDEILAASPQLQSALDELANERIDQLSLKSAEMSAGAWKEETLAKLSGAMHSVSVDDIIKEGMLHGASGAAMAIWLGILIDGIPESLVIGMLSASAAGMRVSFIVGVFLANLPEAMSGSVSMKTSGMNWKRSSLCGAPLRS